MKKPSNQAVDTFFWITLSILIVVWIVWTEMYVRENHPDPKPRGPVIFRHP